jgi:CHAT domain-containing protein
MTEYEREQRFSYMGKGFSKLEEAKQHHKACLAFLDKVLQKISQGKDDGQIMSFLQANLDKLDNNFAKVLRRWATTKLSPVELMQLENAVEIIIFSNLIQELRFGSRANNLEIAITGYKVVAPVFTHKVSPRTWAETQNNMGNAYCNRIYGEQAENLEQALCCYKAALQVYTKEKFPENWAWTLNLLGTAYQDRQRDNQEKNLEKAICCYEAALQVYTEKKFPQGWADTNNNLGNAYCQRIRGNKEDNLEWAIKCYKSALRIYTQNKEKFIKEWIITQSNLGNAYSICIRGNSKENIDLAISSYQTALTICIPEVFPEEWATLQNNLGNTYRHYSQNNKIENFEVAIRCYLDALKVRTCSNFPKDYAVTQFNLGITYQDTQQFDNSYTAFAAAIETVESLRSEIIYGSRKEEDRQRLAEQWNKLYQRMVEVCLELGYYDQAIEYAERSKTRNLVELIITRDLHSIFPSKIVSQLEHLRVEITNGQYQLQAATADNPTALAQHLQQLRQQRNELQDRCLPIGYGFNFEKFEETLDDYTAIIQWYITSTGFETFIITRYSLQRLILPTPADDLKALVDWANEYLDAYGRKNLWIKTLASSLSRLAEILHLEDILKLVPDTCSRLILIPHRFLHLFPLHALPLANGDFLCDRFPKGVGYAPSCQLLQLAQKRERPDFSNLFAVLEPTRPDLPPLFYTNLEVKIIRHHFEVAQIIEKEKATKTALQQSTEYLCSTHCLHFSCHGLFNLAVPLKSGLALADKNFTLAEIFGLDLSQCRLVTLSACETGLSDPTSVSDEYISLPSGFLYAGSPSIVSSLWTVNDLSTAFLMLKFYENLRNFPKLEAGDVAIALNQAQIWLRNLTSEEFEAVFAKYQPQIDEILAQLPKGSRFEFQDSLDLARNKIQAPDRQPKPFANPYYWAAFTATGV